MENRRAFIFAGVCFGISLLLISTYISIRESELTKDFGDRVSVVVATKTIPEYATIRADQIKVVETFSKFKQPGTLETITEVIGKSSYVSIAPNEQVTLTKLIQQDGTPVLESQLKANMRAVTILIAPHTGVSRLVRPGNRVDVLVAPIYDAKGASVVEVKTVVQNALVLATGRSVQNETPTRVDRTVLNYIRGEFEQNRRKDFFGNTENLRTSRPTDDYANVTLELSQEDAKKILFLTHSYGDRSLYLTLRNGADEGVAKLSTTLLDDVLGPDSDFGKQKRRKPPRRKPPEVEFYDLVGGKAKPVFKKK